MIPVLVVAERNTKSVAVAIYEINPSWTRVCDGFFCAVRVNGLFTGLFSLSVVVCCANRRCNL